jgi:hypothetical protein
MRVCVNPECIQPYERVYKCCPYCGHYPPPPRRSAPEFVDGDLLELDAETLAALRGEIARIDGDPVIPYGAGRYHQSVAMADRRPYWRFDGIHDGRQSTICKPLTGVIRRWDDPWWKTRIPPLHFQCRSSFTTLTEAQARVRDELLRVGLVTWAIGAALGLSAVAPPVYITECEKDLRVIADHLGVDREACFLFDDSAKKHIDVFARHPEEAVRAFAQGHMLEVEEFDFTSVDPERAEALRALLERHFPMDGLRETHRRLFNEVLHDPSWPLVNRCITPEERWVVHYPGQRAPVGPWNIEPVLRHGATAAAEKEQVPASRSFSH